MPRRRRRRLLGIAVVSLMLLSGVPIGEELIARSMDRYYAISRYVWVLSWFRENNRPLPSTIQEFESIYSHSGADLGARLPTATSTWRPEYRPPIGLGNGRFLVFVEPRRSGFQLPSRWLFYEILDQGNYSTSAETVWEWEVADRIQSDKRTRDAARARSSSMTWPRQH